jgi:hypothetical protein
VPETRLVNRRPKLALIKNPPSGRSRISSNMFLTISAP